MKKPTAMTFGEPEDFGGLCNARLFIPDIYGDNHATILCHLGPRHEGKHEDRYGDLGRSVRIIWDLDERGTDNDPKNQGWT